LSNSPAPQIAFYDAADGRRLALRRWRPEGRARAHVVFLHGIGSHGGWYTGSCSHLARSGFEVHFLDRHGSGLNLSGAGDVDSWRTWIDDVAAYVKPLHGSLPIVLCGISWGGKLAAAMARLHPGLIDGVGLLCPGLYSHRDPGRMKRMLLALPLSDRTVNRTVRVPVREPELFTDNPVRREFITHDPLLLRYVTVRFARESVRLTQFAQQSATFLHLPTLLMLAGRDRIVENWPVRAYFARIPAVKRTLIEYPNAAHTLEFESESATYFRDLENWIGSAGRCDSCG
jgi:acylglycerol lipase